jgi:protein-S-isoprenylcysteine O-methyltransferase Ste14
MAHVILLITMTVGLVFGGLVHYVVASPDSVAQLPAGQGGGLFRVSAAELAVAEAIGALVAIDALRRSVVARRGTAAVPANRLRHLVAIVVLPFTVAVLIPLWLTRRNGSTLVVGSSMTQILPQVAGLGLLTVGVLLFLASLRRFVTEGRGTLAPWDPPRHLVIRGPYRYVRNPMISGVAAVLFAEALLLLSRPHLIWALIFFGINSVYIPLVEEPALKQRFGDSYREYCRRVPRLIPRLRPWERPRS